MRDPEFFHRDIYIKKKNKKKLIASYLELLEPVVTAKSNYFISPLKKSNDHLKTAFYLLALAMGGDHNRTSHREQKSCKKSESPN